jgi:SanA protein
MSAFVRIRKFVTEYRRVVVISCASVAIILLAAVILNYILIGHNAKYIVRWDALSKNNPPVAIVFGGGIENDQPRPLLKDRLDTAAALLKAGKVRKLLVSGDNRFTNYSEPTVMQQYLVRQKGINIKDIVIDDAGRSTYETCERAFKIFSLHKAVLVSESTHLPRAIYTCRSFGIEAYGYSSDGKSSSGLKVGQRFREILARTKATLNIYVMGEQTVPGNKIPL